MTPRFPGKPHKTYVWWMKRVFSAYNPIVGRQKWPAPMKLFSSYNGAEANSAKLLKLCRSALIFIIYLFFVFIKHNVG